MDRSAWIAAVAGVAFSAIAQAAPFAMITDVKGDAWAVDGGKQRKLALLAYVEAPTEVKVEPATKLGITYFASGVQYSFDGPARVSLESKAPRVIEGSAAQSKKVGPEKAISGGMSNDQWRRLQQATVVMRAVRASFAVVGPDRTVLLAREPEFEWTAAADAKNYRVVIYGPGGDILHEARTGETTFRPGAVVKLEPGKKYRWKVDAVGVAKPVSATGEFAVAEDAVRDRMAAARPGSGAELAAWLLYATNLEAEGHQHDARAEWKALARQHPGVPEISQRGR
ncbi:MAG: hypothetical protein IT513_00665 [Burkholderiales bacterium]|nr:hypothetical protein [Burkholderiales bacterium]